MRKDIVFLALILSFSLFLSSCAYEGYEFEIEELSYKPLETTSVLRNETSPDENSAEAGINETQGTTTSGGRSQTMQGSLEGSLEVNVINPATAIIKLDGETIGTRNVVHSLNPGTYLLEVESEGYAPYVSNIILNPRSERKLRLRLYPEWLPKDEMIKIELFSSNQDQVRQGEDIVISSMFSGPSDTACNIIVDGIEINSLNERNTEQFNNHVFQNTGRKNIELKCSGLTGEQSQAFTVNVYECIDDYDCEHSCINNVCIQEFTEKIDLQIEYYDRFFLWFGRWKEYEGTELKPRTRVRMIVNELPEKENCTPIGTSINIQEKSRSKPITLINPAEMGIVCDNGQEEIVDINVRVESGIIGELIE